MTRRQQGLRVTRRGSEYKPIPESAHSQDPLCSGCCRLSQAGVLRLTETKRLLGATTGAATNGRCSRGSCRRPLARRLAVPATAFARLELVVLTHEDHSTL